jgi:hypothetical protein
MSSLHLHLVPFSQPHTRQDPLTIHIAISHLSIVSLLQVRPIFYHTQIYYVFSLFYNASDYQIEDLMYTI